MNPARLPEGARLPLGGTARSAEGAPVNAESNAVWDGARQRIYMQEVGPRVPDAMHALKA